jgi:hypothetical protein
VFFTREELIESIESKDPRIRNYLETYGFVVIRGLVDTDSYPKLKEEWGKHFDDLKYERLIPFDYYQELGR